MQARYIATPVDYYFVKKRSSVVELQNTNSAFVSSSKERIEQAKEDWKTGLEVLSDLVCNMKISNKDFELEKKVILQEIAMSDDTPEELIYDYFFKDGSLWFRSG